jgi:murein L,D-transpeptidase YafK
VCLFLAGSAAALEQAGGIRIVVWKAKRELWVLRNEKLFRHYPISLGASPEGYKLVKGDGKTPVGVYWVYEKRSETRFHRFLALSYPSPDDAERAFRAGMITADTWADIWVAGKRRQKPPYDTPLGGFVGIHGTGAEGRQARMRQLWDWTEGCIALSDRDVEELYDLTPVGATVEIFE